jgi:type VI protein secretion system component VasK
MPWSFYSTLAAFGVFFACINIYILARWLNHPFSSDLWLIGAIIGLLWLVYSIWMVRRHQQKMVEEKRLKNDTKSDERSQL